MRGGGTCWQLPHFPLDKFMLRYRVPHSPADMSTDRLYHCGGSDLDDKYVLRRHLYSCCHVLYVHVLYSSMRPSDILRLSALTTYRYLHISLDKDFRRNEIRHLQCTNNQYLKEFDEWPERQWDDPCHSIAFYYTRFVTYYEGDDLRKGMRSTSLESETCSGHNILDSYCFWTVCAVGS